MTELFKQVVAVPILNTVFPLIEARAANELSEEDHARGKIILTMRDGDRN